MEQAVLRVGRLRLLRLRRWQHLVAIHQTREVDVNLPSTSPDVPAATAAGETTSERVGSADSTGAVPDGVERVES